MKKLYFFLAIFPLNFLCHAQQTEQEIFREKPDSGAFFFVLGENILSNFLLFLADKYIEKESWAVITPDLIWENLTGLWEWDRDEHFTNQFDHPYQCSIYHAASRSNGFKFFQAILFDVFGSVYCELFCETNISSINDLISTMLGGAALGEMFHRFYILG
jgi:hypothetical protein